MAPHRTPSPMGPLDAGVTQGNFHGMPEGARAGYPHCSGSQQVGAQCPPQTPGPSGHGPVGGQLHGPHLLLVAAVEESILLGGEVAAPVPDHPCGTEGTGSQGRCTHTPPVPPSPIPPDLCA